MVSPPEMRHGTRAIVEGSVILELRVYLSLNAHAWLICTVRDSDNMSDFRTAAFSSRESDLEMAMSEIRTTCSATIVIASYIRCAPAICARRAHAFGFAVCSTMSMTAAERCTAAVSGVAVDV